VHLTLLNGFLDEMQKISATLNELQGAYRRLAPTRMKSAPSKGLMKKVVGAMFGGGGVTQLGAKDISALQGPSTVPGRHQLKALAQGMEGATGTLRHMGHPPEAIEAVQLMGGPKLEESARQAKQWGGTIAMPAGGMTGYLAKQQKAVGSPLPVPAGPTQQRAANILTGLHEGYERGVTTSPSMYYSHLSPEVIHKEHNMLAGLTGPGAQEGRQYFQGLRGAPGQEGPQHAETLQHLYGDKSAPWQTYGEGPKMPKAMRKDIIRRWPEAQQQQGSAIKARQEAMMKEFGGGTE
jgi:hypothetical protein